MAKYAVKNTPFLAVAVVDMLLNAGFEDLDFIDGTEGGFIMVNTDKQTFKLRDTTDRAVIDPATNWAAVAALVVRTAATPSAFTYAIGDTVTMSNGAKTKAKFRLQEGYVYTVDRVKANAQGKEIIGFAGLPNDEYLGSRATKVAGSTATAASAPVATKPAVDAAGNTLAVGDTIIVVQPTGKKPVFSLRPNGVAVINRITAKGAVGFAFDADNEFLAKRVQKVTVAADASGIQSGDLVVVKDDKAKAGTIFQLPTGTALTFRGLTVTGGKFILDGYTDHQYAVGRFQKVTKVGTVA